MPYYAHVMGNKKISQAFFLLKCVEQIQDLGLDGYIKGGNGFVADQKFGLQNQCPGDSDSLPLSARKLMGKTPESIF